MNRRMFYYKFKKNGWNREKRNYWIDFFEYIKLINIDFINFHIITREMCYPMWQYGFSISILFFFFILKSILNQELVGEMIQDLCNYMNVTNLESVANFPVEMQDFNEVLQKVT